KENTHKNADAAAFVSLSTDKLVKHMKTNELNLDHQATKANELITEKWMLSGNQSLTAEQMVDAARYRQKGGHLILSMTKYLDTGANVGVAQLNLLANALEEFDEYHKGLIDIAIRDKKEVFDK